MAQVGQDQQAGKSVYAEDIEVGRVYRLGSHHVSQEELLDFARTWDPQDFHTDEVVAEAGMFGGLIASGLHTLSIYQKLAVLGALREWNVIAGKRLADVRFLRPLRPDTTVSGTMTITDVVFDDRGRALVISDAVLADDEGTALLQVTVEAYVRARSV